MDPKDLIAPCGIDCSHCTAYLNHVFGGPKGRLRGNCAGCLPRDKKCAFVKQRCELLRNKRIRFCYQCPTFPCEQLLKLDRRYEKHGWAVSFAENNRRIQQVGPARFLSEQKARFACARCGGPTSIHEGICYLGCKKVRTSSKRG